MSVLRVWGGAIGSYVIFPTNQDHVPRHQNLGLETQSHSFQNITAFIERSSESTIILDGFVCLLASDSVDDVGATEEWTDHWTSAGAPGPGGRAGPVPPDAQIQDPHALRSREVCLHVVLYLLNTGGPRLNGNGKGKERKRRRAGKAIPLFENHSVLAKLLYKLIYQPCEHPRTSSSLMLYLRVLEDFFARHLAAMAMLALFDVRAPFIKVLYGDGSRVATTCATIELFQSSEFEWYDSATVTPVDLQFYTTLNLQSYVRSDENRCEVVDHAGLFELLSNAHRMLLCQGQIASTSHNTQLDAETRYILESCVVENNRREVQFALNVSYESWKRLADVVLTKCFGRIAHDQSENILFDLLHVLPPAIRITSLPESSAILLSENRRELVRGNIHAAVVNFLSSMHDEREPPAYRTARTSQSAGCTDTEPRSSTGRGAWHGASGRTGTGCSLFASAMHVTTLRLDAQRG
ncbi:hypothetical protein DFH11DRAFT_1882873 [Phellopilus nigrolimitatus]|nr:hypothetical protein DFH11DRAFT_1882873 [Phellopilus nigrolimitatus]